MKTLYIALAFLLLSSYSLGATLTPQNVIAKSISYHDPESRWGEFSGSFSLTTQGVFNENKVDKITITISQQEQLMRYQNERRNIDVSYSGMTCAGSNVAQYCKDFIWARDFYPYVWGLPMKLTDELAAINPKLEKTVFNQQKCWQVGVSYPRHTYKFYFNQESFKLEGFQFIHNADATKGEIIVHDGEFDLGGVKTPAIRTWYDLKMKKLSTDLMKSYHGGIK